MAFRFFSNAINSGAQQKPNEMYHDLQQEFVNLEWINTTAMFKIQEQDDIGLDTYHCVEAWIDSTVGDTTTGMKYSGDFNKLIFKDLNHKITRGQLYKFDDNYWIVHNYSQYSGIVQYCGVRRCNNRLKIVDPLNGKVQSVPCCVDYDMAPPSEKTNRYVITPNNHAVVIVQGNDLTLRLFKTNTRYILSGRPFKLLGFQNAIEHSEDYQKTTLLYLDLYLDEIRDNDDLINGIADNGNYLYNINILSDDMNLISGSTGKLNADITLNGIEVNRDIEWFSDKPEVVFINENGEYEVVGFEEETAMITASIKGNNEINSTISINIVSESDIQPIVVLNPIFEKIRQFETIKFNLQVEYNGQVYTEFDEQSIVINEMDKDYIQLKLNEDNSYSLLALKIKNNPIVLTVHVKREDLNFDVTETFEIKIVSMMG